MVSKLLSTTFSQDALNDAVVAQPSTDKNTQGNEYGTRSTVSAWGFWGWLGYRVHTASTLDQQQALFQELKSELRKQYLDVAFISPMAAGHARKLNSEISSAEKTGVFRGTDRQMESSTAVKLAAIERIDEEIDRLASQKGAFLTPRIIAEFKTKAEVQFASLTMSGLNGYRPQSTGGRVSDEQTFNPLKDYKSLLRHAQSGSEVIRLTTDSDISNKANHRAIESGGNAAKLMLEPGASTPRDENVAVKTLAHCLASLKQAYFRTRAGAGEISTKEVAFDRLVSKYVESRLIDKSTGRLCDLTQGDFQTLERLAFKNRSTIGRTERPFDEMFGAGAGTAAYSRYSGFALDKDVGVIHLINEGARHAAMYIETLDPETHAWKLTKLHFGPTLGATAAKRSNFDLLRDNSPLPGEIKFSEGVVIQSPQGSNEYEVRNREVISQADLLIGKSAPVKALGVMWETGKEKDFTSIRLPVTEIKKIVQTAKTQKESEERRNLQGNVTLYHFFGRSASMDELREELKSYKHLQDTAMLELVRIQMLFEHFSEMQLDSQGEAATVVEKTWFGFKPSALLQSLRDQGLLSLESLQSSSRDTSAHADLLRNMRQRIATIREAYSSTSEAQEKYRDLVGTVRNQAVRFSKRIDGVLQGEKALSGSERSKLQKLSKSEIDGLLSDLWQYQRVIHQLSQKIENLTKIESLELDLKTVRKELEMRKVSKSIADENWTSASRKLAAAMQALKPEGWTKPLTSEALQDYCKSGTFDNMFEEFASAAIRTQQFKLEAQHDGVMSQDDKDRLEAEAERIVNDSLYLLSTAYLRAYRSWSQPSALRAKNSDEDLTNIRARNFGGKPDIHAPISDEALADLGAALESRYNELSADIVKGEDGYTATDERGHRAVRAGNCADWVRSMMRVGGVSIEGIEFASTSSIISARFNPQDPRVLARGRYDRFGVGVVRTGFPLQGNAGPSMRDISPERRTELRNLGAYLVRGREHGAQYDAVPRNRDEHVAAPRL